MKVVPLVNCKWANSDITYKLNDQNQLIFSILDPLSSKLPKEHTKRTTIRSTIKEVYELVLPNAFEP